MTRPGHLGLRPATLLLACCLVWGVNQVAIKVSVSGVSPLIGASVLLGEPGLVGPTPLVLAARLPGSDRRIRVLLVWFWLLRRYRASDLAPFLFWTPLFGVLAGRLLLGDPLSWHLGAAAVLVALGIYLVNRP